MKAVCLLSGGLDSAVAAAMARDEGYEIFPLTVKYGQRHDKETVCARDIAMLWGVQWKVLQIEHPGGSALTFDTEVPLDRNIDESIPQTYVPGRNAIFITLAASYAEKIGAEAVFVGVNALDYSGYPDCRQDFIDAMNRVLAVGLKSGVEGAAIRVKAPLIHMTKVEIIETGVALAVPFKYTWSCYVGGAVPCGRCDSCIIRADGFKKFGIDDPALPKVGA